MNTEIRDKRIYKLIAKQLLEGLDEEEVQELETWLVKPGNRDVYQKITKKEYVKKRIEKWASIDVKKHADAFERRIKPTSVREMIKRYTYAAAVVALLIIGAGTWKYLIKTTNNRNLFEMQILPGKAQAVLVLNDGEQVKLDARKVNEIVEKDGMVIKNDSACINYNREEKGTGTGTGTGLVNTVIVPTGGEYNLVLSDGTMVYLNSESKIEFPVRFAGAERVVTLEGEAYFQVAASKEHPFIVKTKDLNVMVTGTEFNVKAYPDELNVQATLLHGEVTVFTDDRENEKTKLMPNQQAQWNREEVKLEVRDVDPSLFVAWRSGQFIFRKDRLEDIMKTLSRWYDMEVVYLDDSIADMTFAGKLDRSEDIMPILNVLRATDKLAIEIKGKQIILGIK